MGVSRLDVFYRRLLLTKLFIGGWGKPEDLKRIFEFRKIVGDREKCKTLVPVDYPVYITKTEELADCRIHDGFFISPLEQLVPGILPPEAVKARFFFWRRRTLMARPMIKEAGMASLLLENPYYILFCVRSICSGVPGGSDPGVCYPHRGGAWDARGHPTAAACGALGGSVVADMGYWPRICAAAGWIQGWPKDLGCSFGLSVYLWLQGVLSRAVNWAELEKQYAINSVYEREIFKLLEYCGVDSYKMGTEVQRRLDSLGDLLDLPGGLQVSAGRRFNVDMQCATSANLSLLPVRPPSAPSVGRGRNMNSANCCRPSLQTESISFMKGVMDECTHMANFSVPVDTSLIIVIQAREDAYIPRTGVLSLQEIWPGCEVRYLNGGHISAYLFKQNFFRKSIYDAFDRFCLKYPSSP
uniref:Abhydrolase domain containing 18 n=1 Tax=Cyprinodon variegatus TaxID=28743 RepID=A0A3Q2EE78_CYPVA